VIEYYIMHMSAVMRELLCAAIVFSVRPLLLKSPRSMGISPQPGLSCWRWVFCSLHYSASSLVSLLWCALELWLRKCVPVSVHKAVFHKLNWHKLKFCLQNKNMKCIYGVYSQDYCENTLHAPVGLAHTHPKCQKLHCSSVTMLSEMSFK